MPYARTLQVTSRRQQEEWVTAAYLPKYELYVSLVWFLLYVVSLKTGDHAESKLHAFLEKCLCKEG